MALGWFRQEAKPAVPALLKILRLSEGAMRADVERALKAIDPEAAAQAGIR